MKTTNMKTTVSTSVLFPMKRLAGSRSMSVSMRKRTLKSEVAERLRRFGVHRSNRRSLLCSVLIRCGDVLTRATV